ncbi:MAG: lytic transglycosylase domain-containing protein, partial [Pseudomonadota bacterium]
IVSSAFREHTETPPSNAPKEFIDMAFPRVHQAVTMQAARKHSVDPNLVWAVIRQESLYDPSVVSPAGALGLMQVTPEATGTLKKKGNVPASVVADLLEPKKNLGHGVKILGGNIQVFKGRLVPAIASYNADIQKVHQWVKKNSRMADDEFIDNIPYHETRLYVKKVLAGYKAYEYLHKKKDLAARW